MTPVEKLKKLTKESDDELLSLLLETAEDIILELTNRKTLPKKLEGIKVKLAVIAYNRMGTEGETSRSEGGISSAFSDLPEDILRAIKSSRLARVGGKAYEKTDTEKT